MIFCYGRQFSLWTVMTDVWKCNSFRDHTTSVVTVIFSWAGLVWQLASIRSVTPTLGICQCGMNWTKLWSTIGKQVSTVHTALWSCLSGNRQFRRNRTDCTRVIEIIVWKVFIMWVVTTMASQNVSFCWSYPLLIIVQRSLQWQKKPSTKITIGLWSLTTCHINTCLKHAHEIIRRPPQLLLGLYSSIIIYSWQ